MKSSTLSTALQWAPSPVAHKGWASVAFLECTEPLKVFPTPEFFQEPLLLPDSALLPTFDPLGLASQGTSQKSGKKPDALDLASLRLWPPGWDPAFWPPGTLHFGSVAHIPIVTGLLPAKIKDLL